MEFTHRIGISFIPTIFMKLTTSVSNLESGKLSKQADYIGMWSTQDGFQKDASYQYMEIPRYFKIGTVRKYDYVFVKRYFLHEMSKLMNFDYDVILPTDGCKCFGEKLGDGTWTGLIGTFRYTIIPSV